MFSALLFLVLPWGGPLTAQDTVQSLIGQVKKVQGNEDASEGDLQRALDIMKRIVDEFPASDAAVSILLLEKYEGVDFSSFENRMALMNKPSETLSGNDAAAASVDRKAECVSKALGVTSTSELRLKLSVGEGGRIEGLPELTAPVTPTHEERRDYLTLVAALDDCAPFTDVKFGGEVAVITSAGSGVVFESLSNGSSAEPAVALREAPIVPEGQNLRPKFAKSSEQTENGLNLNRQGIRDVQARLLVIGFDPNGVDGVIGRGTRSALRGWQVSVGLSATGFLSELQLTLLKEKSQEKLDEWLKNKNNAKLYSPPKRSKPIARKPVRSKSSGWYRNSRGMYCKRGNFGSYCQLWKPKALR